MSNNQFFRQPLRLGLLIVAIILLLVAALFFLMGDNSETLNDESIPIKQIVDEDSSSDDEEINAPNLIADEIEEPMEQPEDIEQNLPLDEGQDTENYQQQLPEESETNEDNLSDTSGSSSDADQETMSEQESESNIDDEEVDLIQPKVNEQDDSDEQELMRDEVSEGQESNELDLRTEKETFSDGSDSDQRVDDEQESGDEQELMRDDVSEGQESTDQEAEFRPSDDEIEEAERAITPSSVNSEEEKNVNYSESQRLSDVNAETIVSNDFLAPKFDTVRVDQYGIAVVSGRAEPNTKIQSVVNGVPLQEDTVGQKGQFAMIFEVNPEESSLEIVLNTITSDGQIIPSNETVVVLQSDFATYGSSELNINNSLQAPAQDIVENANSLRPTLLLSSLGDVKLLQPVLPNIDNKTLVETITYDETGEVIISGRASNINAIIRIYVDNAYIKDVEINADKSWSSDLQELLPGRYTIRIDEVGIDGDVTGRVEMPLQKEGESFVKSMLNSTAAFGTSETGVETELIQLITVQRGYTLWGISRNRFGLGRLYVNIFDLNKNQISDPDLIYPGQIFKIPQSDQLFDPEYGGRLIPNPIVNQE